MYVPNVVGHSCMGKGKLLHTSPFCKKEHQQLMQFPFRLNNENHRLKLLARLITLSQLKFIHVMV